MFENTFTLIGDDGKEIACEMLFTFDWKVTGKSYIVYTDHTTDEFGCESVFASTYDPSGADTMLGAIETEEEWDLVDRLLTQIMEEVAAKDEDAQITKCNI